MADHDEAPEVEAQPGTPPDIPPEIAAEARPEDQNAAAGPPPFAPGQFVTVFRSRLRSDVGHDYQQLAEEMEALGRAMPGFVDFKTFTADDGERLALTTFSDAESQRAWRAHPRHRIAQQTGRDRFYAWYSIQVCDCTSAHAFTLPPGEESTVTQDVT